MTDETIETIKEALSIIQSASIDSRNHKAIEREIKYIIFLINEE